MIFASYTYLAFLAAGFLVHWALPVRLRKPFLVVWSYVFYCSWKWQYGFLLLGVSLFSWAFGRVLAKRQEGGSLLLVGVLVELAPLLYFKYTNFFVQNLAGAARAAGADWHPGALDILLPLGISFFTFQGIAYLVDVAAGEPPFERLSDFLLFKGFWPQLIAGPILRPDELRAQIEQPRTLDYDDVAEGSRRILFGLFKKMVLADMLAPIVDMVFAPNARPGMVDGLIGVAGFGAQIYWDFSAYSEIAIGSARLFGYRFPENFDWPYASRSPQEFWNRWHMSLSRWIRDYVFSPLSFAFRATPRLGLVWLVVAMAVCGLWHGAQWTFVLWGVWHGVWLVLGQTWLRPLFQGLDPKRPARRGLRGLAGLVVTLAVANAGWLLFRAQTLEQAGRIARSVFTLEGGFRPAVLRENDVLIVAGLYACLLASQVLLPLTDRLAQALRERTRLRSGLSGALYALALLAIVVFDQESKAFVYFQF